MRNVTAELFELLPCPQCKGLVERVVALGGVCGFCRLVYPVCDDIPVTLIDEAMSLAD